MGVGVFRLRVGGDSLGTTELGDGNKGVRVPRIRVREVWKGSRDRIERWVEAGGGQSE